MTQKKQMTNPLGTDRISTLVARFAVPSIIATLVSAVYNIADQLFIGNAVGTLGNAATNVAFPLSMLCASLALLFGIGGASSFNLHMGAGRKEEAPYLICPVFHKSGGQSDCLWINAGYTSQPIRFAITHNSLDCSIR